MTKVVKIRQNKKVNDNFSAIVLGNRRELFIDDYLTEHLDGISLKVHTPQAQVPEPTQPVGHYMTMLSAEGKLRCYCRKSFFEFTGAHPRFHVKPGFVNDYTAYGESTGGVKWLEPPLFLYDCGVPNVMRCLHWSASNFAPFYDENPACPPEERYKALAGDANPLCGGGLHGFVSANGYEFRELPGVLITPKKSWGYCFDSQNVAFWSEAENCYVCYFRLNVTPDGRKLRTICKATSPDFRHWGNFMPQEVNLENEHLYVSQFAPYPRAPHLYVGTPTRYCEERGSATDIALLFSRAGGPIIRPQLEGWIRPGFGGDAWSNRYNYLARGVVQTGPAEMSLYHCHSQVRYTLRLDGFTSLHAGYAAGEWLSKPLLYEGGSLNFNVATSVYGSFQTELQTVGGKTIPGYTLADAEPFYGDSIEYRPSWRDRTEFPLKPGEAFRLRCQFREADLYSFQIH